MCPERERQNAGGHHRHHDRRVSHEAPPAKRRDDFRHDAECRHEDDVDLGVAEEPEEMLPQQRIAAQLRSEELRLHGSIGGEQHGGHRDRRHREHDHARRHHLGPHEDRELRPRHARRALLEHRHEDLDGGNERRDLREGHGLRPDIDAVPR